MEEKLERVAEVMPSILRHDVFYLGPIPITSTIINMWIVMAALFLGVWLLTRKGFKEIPTGVQAFLESIFVFFYWIIDQGYGEKGRKYLPIVGGYFTFIAAMNLSWFIPGMVPPTTDLMTTGALGVTAVLLTHVMGVRAKGVGGYFKHYTSPTPIMAPMNLLEEVVKPFSLAIRLFGNMFGENMVVGMLALLVPLLVPVPVMMLGILFGVIQAYIFTLLITTYLATFTAE